MSVIFHFFSDLGKCFLGEKVFFFLHRTKRIGTLFWNALITFGGDSLANFFYEWENGRNPRGHRSAFPWSSRPPRSTTLQSRSWFCLCCLCGCRLLYYIVSVNVVVVCCNLQYSVGKCGCCLLQCTIQCR